MNLLQNIFTGSDLRIALTTVNSIRYEIRDHRNGYRRRVDACHPGFAPTLKPAPISVTFFFVSMMYLYDIKFTLENKTLVYSFLYLHVINCQEMNLKIWVMNIVMHWRFVWRVSVYLLFLCFKLLELMFDVDNLIWGIRIFMKEGSY